MTKKLILTISFLIPIVLGTFFFESQVLAAVECEDTGRVYTDPAACASAGCLRCVGTTAAASRFRDFFPSPQVPDPRGPVQSPYDILDILVGGAEWAQVFFWILAVVFGLYAAYLYLFSGGDPGKIKAARQQFIYTAVAVALAILALSIPALVTSFIVG